MKKFKKFGVLLIATAILIPSVALGATLKYDQELYLNKGEVVNDNLYAVGGIVSVNSNISGDLLAAGGNILISEDISADLLVAGGSVTVLGDVEGDARIIGGNVLITGNIKGDLAIAGGSVVISKDATIGKDLILAGGQVTIDGNVSGGVRIVAGRGIINGNINGNLDITIDEQLTLGKNAFIGGNITHKSKDTENLVVENGAKIIGATTFTKSKSKEGDKESSGNFFLELLGALAFYKLFTSLIIAFIIAWLFKKFSKDTVSGIVRNPFKMLGKGLVALILTPIVAIIFFVTLVGIPFGVVALLSYIILILISAMYMGIVTGAWISKIINKSEEVTITWKNIIGGVILLMIIGLIPFAGWVAVLFIFLATLGSVADIAQKKLWGDR